MARAHRNLPILAALLLPAILGAGRREVRETGRERPAAAPSTPFPWRGRYEENLGQVAAPVPFLLRGPGFDAGFTPSGAVLSLDRGFLRMEVESAAPGGRLEPSGLLPGRTNHFRGRDPAKWVRGARGFARLSRRGVLPGVDLSWRVEGGHPAYGFSLAPGADPAGVVLRFEGAASLRVEEDGSLAVGVPGGILRHSRPVAWQGRTRVPAAFEVLGPGRVGFRVDRRDPARPLVIDPSISYSTYFGEKPGTEVTCLGPAAGGALLIGGYTQSPILVPGVLLQDTIVEDDAFVASLAPGGGRLEFATFLGGYKDELCISVAADGSGGAWLTGTTDSEDFPVKDALQGQIGGYQDAFVARILPGGADVAFSTYLGGKDPHPGTEFGPYTSGGSLAPLAGGGCMVGVTTSTTDMPVLLPFQAANAGGNSDGFVARFSDSGTQIHGSYLGGNGTDSLRSAAACPDGSAVFAGQSLSSNFPRVGGVNGIQGTQQEVFLAKVPADGGSLAWTQLFGGTATDTGRSVAVLPSGAVVVGGSMESSNFPKVNPLGTATGSYLSVFSADGSALVFSTSLPDGALLDEVGADSDGAAYAVGTTRGLAGTLVSPIQPTLLGVQDAFLLKVAPDFSGYLFSSYLGGSGYEYSPVHLAVEDSNHAWISGRTDSADLQLKSPIQTVKQNDFLLRVTFAGTAPSGLSVEPLVGRRAKLLWFDETDDETGFEIERRKETGAFVPAGIVGGDVVTFTDSQLIPLTQYGYRVRALRPGGPTAWSEEAMVTTLDVAPLPPTGVVATGTSRSTIRLDWTRGSLNETGFQLLRRTRGGVPFLRSVLPAGTVVYQDTGLQPARSYGYVVKALNDLGSADSVEFWGTSLGTLLPATTGGTVRDSATPGKDQMKVSGTLAFDLDSPDGFLDPILDGVAFRLGGEESPFLDYTIQPSSLGWTLRRGVYRWKSPPGARPRVGFTLDTVKGTFRMTATALEFPSAPTSPVEFWLSTGNDAGVVVEPWAESKPGSGKFRR
jgi:hypothetical protein